MQLSIVKLENKLDNSIKYFAVDDIAYDAMLASPELELYPWFYIGEINIEDHVMERLIKVYNESSE